MRSPDDDDDFEWDVSIPPLSFFPPDDAPPPMPPSQVEQWLGKFPAPPSPAYVFMFLGLLAIIAGMVCL